MEYLIIVLIIILLVIILQCNFRFNKKQLEKLAKDEQLDKISQKYPENIQICKEYLEMLNNQDVKIEEDNNIKNCLYIAISNKIIIANIKESYTRIQTIAHECLHSVQDKKLLLFNFIFSNIYLLYFLVITILAIIGILPYKMMFLNILILFSMVYLLIRNYLENDAMIEAKYLAKEYMERRKLSNEKEVKRLVNKLDEINNVGIKCVNFSLFLSCIWKIVVFCVICILR